MRLPADMYDGELKEVLKLLEQQDAQADGPAQEEGQAAMPSKEELIKELMEGDKDEVLSGEQAAMVEFSMMMKQWEALVEDYERREAEEAAEAAAGQAAQNEAH